MRLPARLPPLLLALSLIARAGAARAQNDTGAPVDVNNVVAPRLEADSPAQYPEQALRDKVREAADVGLVLELDETGRVKRATVERPAGHGFDEAALDAARGLRFQPAIRGGSPIASKIRFRYAFAPPPGRLVGRVARRATDSAIAGAEVVVRDSAGAVHTVRTDAEGRFRVGGLPAGTTHLHVEAPRNEAADLDEEVAPGEETELVLRLTAVAEAPPPPPPGVTPTEIDEVKVRGDRPPREVTKRTISRSEIQVSPGTNGDAIRALENLPGVARPPPFSGQLVVRGSGPQDTQYFLDGTNVPIVTHFGGLSSVVPSEVVERIDFFPGNFGAQYGRGMGGIVDVALRAPRDNGKLHGMVQLDSIDIRALVERSLGKGWSFLAAGRRSYFDAYIALLTPGGVDLAPRYYDYQLMLRKELGPEHDVRFTFLGSDDRLVFTGFDGGDFLLGGTLRAAIGFWRLQAKYSNKVSSTTRMNAVVATGQDSIDFGFGENYVTVDTRPVSGRAEVSQRVVKQLGVNVGIDMLTTPYTATVRFPPFERPGVPGGGIGAPPLKTVNEGSVYTPGAYAELELTPVRGTRIVPGFRADYTNQTKEWNYSPRVVARQDLTTRGPRTTLKGGGGLFFQPPSPFELDPVFGQRGLVANRSTHYSAGVEQELGSHLELSVEGFYKKFDRQVAIENGNRGDGRAFGTETLLRWKNDPKFFGWIAYTLSKSERRETPDELLRTFQYDQTHILTVLASKAWGEGFRLGARFRFVSGNLYTPNAYGGVLDMDRAAYQPVSTLPLYGARMEAFHQLDVRFEKTIIAKPLSSLNGYIDVQNIYAHRSQEGVAYSYNYATSQPLRGLTTLSIIGVRADFDL